MSEKIGRPTNYSPELADSICSLVAEGKSLRSVCRMDEMPSMTSVFKWLRIHEEFAQQYAMAKDASADALADEIVDIADDRQDDPDAASRRVRIDARKWVASKLKPKRYGDRIEQEVKVTTSIEEVLSRRLGRITE